MPSSTSASPNGRANRLRLAKQDCPMGPLTGLKVIDLTHVMAGPTCSLMLADMGAEVIKVEKTPSGDDSRDARSEGNPGRLCASTENWARAVGRELAIRGRAGADLLAVGNCTGDWGSSERHGVGAPAQRPLPSF